MVLDERWFGWLVRIADVIFILVTRKRHSRNTGRGSYLCQFALAFKNQVISKSTSAFQESSIRYYNLRFKLVLRSARALAFLRSFLTATSH